MSLPRLVRTGVAVGLGVVVGKAVWERLSASDGPDPVSGSRYRDSLGWRLYDNAAAAADGCVGWDKLPTPLGLAVLTACATSCARRTCTTRAASRA